MRPSSARRSARSNVLRSSDCPSAMRMNGFGYALRDTGHKRVPEPPDKMTGINIGAHSLVAGSLVARQFGDHVVESLLPRRQIYTECSAEFGGIEYRVARAARFGRILGRGDRIDVRRAGDQSGRVRTREDRLREGIPGAFAAGTHMVRTEFRTVAVDSGENGRRRVGDERRRGRRA